MNSREETNFLQSLSNRKIFIHTGFFDFRCGIDTLVMESAAANTDEYYNGSVFVYCAKSRTQIRLVFWEGCGNWMLTRKLSSKRFMWISKNSNKTEVLACYEELKSLISDPLPENKLSRLVTLEKLKNRK